MNDLNKAVSFLGLNLKINFYRFFMIFQFFSFCCSFRNLLLILIIERYHKISFLLKINLFTDIIS